MEGLKNMKNSEMSDGNNSPESLKKDVNFKKVLRVFMERFTLKGARNALAVASVSLATLTGCSSASLGGKVKIIDLDTMHVDGGFVAKSLKKNKPLALKELQEIRKGLIVMLNKVKTDKNLRRDVNDYEDIQITNKEIDRYLEILYHSKDTQLLKQIIKEVEGWEL